MNTIMYEQLLLVAMAAAALCGVWAIVPRCPECGCLLTVRDMMDPSLRHCRRCLSIFKTEGRR